MNAFEAWCYRRMLRISWNYHTTNIDVDLLQNFCVNETTMLNNLKTGHIMRDTSGHCQTLLTTRDGILEGKPGRGRSKRAWVDDLRDWTGSKRYNQIKREAKRGNLYGTFATHSSGRNTE